MEDDELMNDPSLIGEEDVHDIYFQFDEDEPIHFAYTVGDDFSLTLVSNEVSSPAVVFSDGKGKNFKIFMRKNGVQQEIS